MDIHRGTHRYTEATYRDTYRHMHTHRYSHRDGHTESNTDTCRLIYRGHIRRKHRQSQTHSFFSTAAFPSRTLSWQSKWKFLGHGPAPCQQRSAHSTQDTQGTRQALSWPRPLTLATGGCLEVQQSWGGSCLAISPKVSVNAGSCGLTIMNPKSRLAAWLPRELSTPSRTQVCLTRAMRSFTGSIYMDLQMHLSQSTLRKCRWSSSKTEVSQGTCTAIIPMTLC